MFITDPSRKPTDIFLYTLQKGVIIFAGGLFRAKLFPFQPMLIASQE